MGKENREVEYALYYPKNKQATSLEVQNYNPKFVQKTTQNTKKSKTQIIFHYINEQNPHTFFPFQV